MSTQTLSFVRFSKWGVIFTSLFAVIIGATLFMAPRDLAQTKAESCSPLYDHPIFNPYPLSPTQDRSTGCDELYTIAVHKDGEGASSYRKSLSAQPGEELWVRVYVHNGGRQDLPDQTTAYDVKSDIYISDNSVSTTLSGSNIASISDSINIQLPAGAHLEGVLGSGETFDANGNSTGATTVNQDSAWAYFGTQKACFEFARFVRFKVKVVGPAQTAEPILTANLGNRIDGQCLYNGSVNWNATGFEGVQVFVVDPNNGQESLMAAQESGSSETPWLTPNKRVYFRLKSNGQLLKEAYIDVPNLDCGGESTQPQPATLTVQLGNRVTGQCVYNGSVTWNATGYPGVQLLVVNTQTNQEELIAAEESGSVQTPWLTPSSRIYFRLKSNGQLLKEAFVDVPNLDCGTAPQPVTLTATLGSRITGQCLYNGSVTWSAVGYPGVQVFVVNSETGQENLIAAEESGSAQTPWLTPNKNVVFRLKSNGQLLKETSVNVPNLDCGTTTQPVTLTVQLGSRVTGQCVYNGTVTWSAVGYPSVRLFVVNTETGQENLVAAEEAGTAQTPWLTPNKTVIFRLKSNSTVLKETSVNVPNLDCGSTTPPPAGTLVCTASASSVEVNKPVTFTASGITGPFAWALPGAFGGQISADTSVVSGNQYSTTGPKTVTVSKTSTGQVATCNINVTSAPVQQGIIQLTKDVRNVSKGETFSDSTFAENGQTVEYKISVWAGSSVTLTGVRVTDTFESGLAYIDGSLKVNGAAHAPGLTSGGLVFDNVTSAKIEITYQAKVTATSGTILNTARATASNASNSPSDTATVNVVTVNPGQPTLTIDKQVRTGSVDFSHSIAAKKGDTLSYRIVVKNIGSATANNVFVSDTSSNISGLAVSKAYSGNWPNISLGNLVANETITITYNVSVTIENGTIINDATVSASNAATKTDRATVNVSTTTTTPPSAGGNTNNVCTGVSCNTTTLNTCVNNSCNTTNTTNTTTTNTNTYYYINQNGNTIPSYEFRQLGITKSVRNINGGAFQNSVTVNTNETVEFEVIVTNTGNQVVNNVRVTDNLPGSLSLVFGSVRVDGSIVSDSNLTNGMYLGSLITGQQKRINFQARVNSSSNTSIQNFATASGDSVSSVQDDAWVFVNPGNVAGGNVSLTYSKRAWNDSKNADATSINAAKEDYITYTLTVTNTGNAPANSFVITDDLSAVLPYADISDNGGGTVSGNVISFPGITVPAGGSVSKSFKVRVKFFLADNLSYVMTNVYGNTVTIHINTPQVKGTFIAPKTGADTAGFLFSGLMTSAFAIFRKRKGLLKLIFT